MRLCMERVLPPCRERTIKFSLPPIEAARTGMTCGPSPHDVSRAMDAVTSALARGEITPVEAETIAGVVDTFVRAIATTKKDGSRLNLLQILRRAMTMTKIPRMIPMAEIMKKPANMKKPMIRFVASRDAGSRIVYLSTGTGDFAADLLQVQPSVTIGSIHDCRLDHHVRVVRGQQIYPAAGEVIVPFQALRRSGT